MAVHAENFLEPLEKNLKTAYNTIVYRNDGDGLGEA